MTPRNKRRVQLLLVFGIFAVPVVIAWILVNMGWHPGTFSHGKPILPQRSFASVTIDLADGGTWAWRDSKPRFTLVALPGPDCAAACGKTLNLLRNARISLNKNMDRVRLLYVGAAPADASAVAGWTRGSDSADAFKAFRPSASDSVAALLVEPDGTALVDYPAGFDPSGLRDDLEKVLRR